MRSSVDERLFQQVVVEVRGNLLGDCFVVKGVEMEEEVERGGGSESRYEKGLSRKKESGMNSKETSRISAGSGRRV